MLTPALLISISYTLGIITGKFIQIPFLMIFIAFVLLAVASYVLLKRQQKAVYLIFFIFFVSGVFAYQYSNLIPLNDVSFYANNKYVKVTGNVADEPVCSSDTQKIVIKVKEISVRGKTYNASGFVSVYVKSPKFPLEYGNKLIISGVLSKIDSTGNPGVSSYVDLMSKKKIRAQMFVLSHQVKVISRTKGNLIKHVSIIIKNRLLSVIQSTMSEPYSSLLGSIIFGSQASPLPDDLQENYRTAGVIHLLVVSGTQVSIIISSVMSLCGFFGFSRRAILLIVTCANILFAVMVGGGSSIVRAAVMSEAALIARTVGRDNDFYNSLALSALALLIFNPQNLFDIGFQLSFLATWALFFISPVLEERLKLKLPAFFANLVSISIAPTIATAPIVLYNFGQISFVSIFTNLIILPWVEMTVLLGFASTLIGMIFLPLAYIINNTMTIILALLNGMIYLFSSLPFACRYFAPPAFPIILIYYGLIIWIIETIRTKRPFNLNKPIIIGIVLIVFCVSGIRFTFATEKDLTVTFLDVGQGDSILIESPSGKKALIDGGGSAVKEKGEAPGKYIIVPYLRKKGINTLDYVILTHPHDDHVGGLAYVIDKIKVNNVIDSGQPHSSPSYMKFLKAVEKMKITYKLARAGGKFDLGGGVTGYILNPSEPFLEGTDSDLNNNSVVIRLLYGKTSFLFPGDLGFEGEKRVLSYGYDIKSDVLKIGHHGSRTSSSGDFLAAVKPRYAVISVGKKNRYGHPSLETLGRLAENEIKVYRTDMNGAIVIKSDGVKVYPYIFK